MTTHAALPSRFVASATASAGQPVVDDPAQIEDVRAVVRLRGRGGVTELVIGTDARGGLCVTNSARDRLEQRARAQLAFHDVASGRTIDIAGDAFHVFDLQAVEMLPDAPGANDALYLYGVIRGPYPAKHDLPIASVAGQLTVTRADLLAGLIDGTARAFAYAPEPRGSRCVHALLPGERADVIESGRGIILALPLAPAWTLDSLVSNDLVSAQTLYDVLVALRADLGIPDEPPLPVASRPLFEQSLVAAGWRIDGNEAVRAKSGGLLGSVFGGAERRALPREATLDELVAEARACLSRLPGVPSAEVVAIERGRLHAPVVPAAAHASPRTPPPPAVPPASQPRPRVDTPRTEWMKDFVEAHRAPARPRPTVTAPARVVTPDATPSWMKDFADTEKPEKAPTDETAAPGDWSKDFD